MHMSKDGEMKKEANLKDALLIDYEQSFEQYRYQDNLLAFQFYVGMVVIGILFGLVLGYKLGVATLVALFFIGLVVLCILLLSIIKCRIARDCAMDRLKEIETKTEFKDKDVLIARCRIFDKVERSKIIERRKKLTKKLEQMFERHSVAQSLEYFMLTLIIVWTFICASKIITILN